MNLVAHGEVRQTGELPRAKGIQLEGPNGPIKIKWHRLRRVAGDVDFTAARLREGLAAGASLEIDLRRHAEKGFVCLHDAMLEFGDKREGCGRCRLGVRHQTPEDAWPRRGDH